MTKIKHIIWDWNGTLVNDGWLFVELMNLVLEKRNLPKITLSDYKNTFCFPLEKYYQRLGFDFNKESYLVPSLEFIKLYDKNKYRAELYPGAVELLANLKQKSIKNYLLSAQNHDSLLELINYYGIGNLFEKIQGTNNLHARGKPLLASGLLQSENINQKTVLFIGDTNMDLEIAFKNKAPALGLTFGHQSEGRFSQTNKVTLMHSFRELNFYLSVKFLENL